MTDQELKDLVASLAVVQKQTDEQMKKTDEQMKKTDEQMKRTDKRLNKMAKRHDKDHNTLYGMGVTQGDISEDIFSENIEDILFDAGKEITSIDENVKKLGKVEIDLVCLNGAEAFAVEVKTKLRKTHIDKFINKSLPRLRKYFPKYDKYRLYGTVAGRTIEKGVEKYAEEKGLYIIKEMHNGKAKMLSKNDFKAKEFVF